MHSNRRLRFVSVSVDGLDEYSGFCSLEAYSRTTACYASKQFDSESWPRSVVVSLLEI
ncbi:hypothetical protein BDD12DRAFT_893775 [Trichophaea hybrida]|nr:hypothetical protein BDD12DRAFT_893775 [Trichophaea hybrida]